MSNLLLLLSFSTCRHNYVHDLSCHSFKFLWKTVLSKPPTIPFGVVMCTLSDNLSWNSCIGYIHTCQPPEYKNLEMSRNLQQCLNTLRKSPEGLSYVANINNSEWKPRQLSTKYCAIWLVDFWPITILVKYTSIWLLCFTFSNQEQLK